MAAICGIREATGRAAERALLDAMLTALADYGAERAAWGEGAVGMGWRGVPAADRAGAVESIRRDAAAGLVLVADARLDDRDALCGALGVHGAERTVVGDGDLILRAYRRWGRACPRRLLGDYAFAVWDQRKRLLFCARDHVGARPFYYSSAGGRFVFASAVEAVLAAGVSNALDEAAVVTHLTTPLLRSDTHTFFAAVRKLPPGHVLTVAADAAGDGTGDLRLERYWQPEHAPLVRPASDDACAEQLLHLYAQAVRDRLRTSGRGRDGDVGVHVSGGLDSSSVAVLATRELRRQGRQPPLAFTWLPPLGDAPPEPRHVREYALVSAVCAREDMQAAYYAPTAEDIVDVLRRDGTFPDAHVHLNEEVVQRAAAAHGVRVLLSGWGGDECVSYDGRGYWQSLLLSGHWRQLAAERRARDAAALRFLGRVALPIVSPHLAWTLDQWRQGRRVRGRWLVNPAFARRAKPLVGSRRREIGVRRTQLQLLRRGHLGVRMEGWTASGARHGLEYRYPLLERRLLEFALGLPPEQFRRGRWSRWIFRRALRTVLPHEVCWNADQTDPARSGPLIDAFVESFPKLHQLLAARPPARAGYVDVPRLCERLHADSFRANPQPTPMLRALLFLDLSG